VIFQIPVSSSISHQSIAGSREGPTLVQTDVGTSTELAMNTGTADFVLKLVASNGGGSVQTILDVDVTSSADPCFQ
jgi:hypothetical protein